MRHVENSYPVLVDGRWRGYRSSINEVADSDWMSPAEAEAALNQAQAETPMPRRQYLVWRASVGLLRTKASRIVEEFGSGSDPYELVYEQIPLLEEWNEQAWTAAHADFWTTANFRLVRNRDSMNGLITFEDIAFERAGIETVVELYRHASNGGLLPTGDPGRPSKGRELYLAEFEKRAAADHSKPSAKLEAEDLRDWFKLNHPTAILPTAKTIENNIRPRMRALKIIP
jgi:hypothetical protein